MKRTVKIIALLLCLVLLAACGKTEAATGLWADALYSEDTELGSGGKTVTVTVEAEEKSIVFTLHTDCATLGEALMEHGLIAGEQSDFGLYVKQVNGITADYDIDGYYWGFYSGGEYMLSGVDMTEIAGGESYELVRTK